MNEIQQEKSAIREQMRAVRRSLPDRATKSAAIIDNALSFSGKATGAHSGCLFTYLAAYSEVDTVRHLNTLLRTFREVCVPNIDADQIWPALVKDGDSFVSRCGFPEIEASQELVAARRVELNQINIAFVPGLAFDLDGFRLGSGKGYYDRFFANAPRSIVRVGLAFDCQLLDRVPREPHDLPMDAIITETRVIAIRSPLNTARAVNKRV